MLQKVDRFAPFIAAALLGYLTYGAVSGDASKPGEGKSAQRITKKMLTVKLEASVARASPADRDPFEVSWASYLNPKATAPPAEATTAPAAPQPASAPAPPAVPPLPGPLEGVFIGEDLRLAVIAGRLYKPGSLVGSADPRACWRVDGIEQDRVTLRFLSEQRVLTLMRGQTTSAPTGPDDERVR